jgi:hypothetical protein
MRSTRASRRLAVVAASTLVLLLALPAAGKVQVASHPEVDFTRFKTYAWGEMRRPEKDQVQQWAVLAIERSLQDRGLRKVDREEADLLVEVSLMGAGHIAASGNFVRSPTTRWVWMSVDIRAIADGQMQIDMFDNATGEGVWRGMATGSAFAEDPIKIEKAISKMARKIVSKYPPK